MLHDRQDWRKWFEVYRLKFMRELKKELGELRCWECNKSLSPEDATFLLDHGGIIVWCCNCAIGNISHAEMWRKILGKPRQYK